MREGPQDEIRKRILFLCFVLGSMAGIGAYLIFKAVQQGSFTLVVALLPMAIASVPLTRALARLRRERVGPPAEDRLQISTTSES